METFDQDSNCNSINDTFSLYERYMRSFLLTEQFEHEENSCSPPISFVKPVSSPSAYNQSSNQNGERSSSAIDLNLLQSSVLKRRTSVHIQIEERPVFGSEVNHHFGTEDQLCRLQCANEANGLTNLLNNENDETCDKALESDVASLLDNSLGGNNDNSLINDKSQNEGPLDLRASSEDTKSDNSSQHPKPVMMTSLITMENSNNAVDSGRLFDKVGPSTTDGGCNVFKLPISELTFNGSLKHVQTLKPIVDPKAAFTTVASSYECRDVTLSVRRSLDISTDNKRPDGSDDNGLRLDRYNKECNIVDNFNNNNTIDRTIEDFSQSTSNTMEEIVPRLFEVDGALELSSKDTKWSSERSCSPRDESFDSGARSPDLFSDDDGPEPLQGNFWKFIDEQEALDKAKVDKMEIILQGVLPPPSVTVINTDVAQMLNNYYKYLPLFNDTATKNTAESNSSTPRKRTSFIKIPPEVETSEPLPESLNRINTIKQEAKPSTSSPNEINRGTEYPGFGKESEDSSERCPTRETLKMCTEAEIKEASWPDVLKLKHHGVHYNTTKYTERLETLMMRCCERFVGAETMCSVTAFSAGHQSPSSAQKRKALRVKMAQTKSPGRRLSHLARRRQAFCSAATLSEKTNSSTSKMVLIDKNFFPHRKLTYTSERKSPRTKRTPGKKTPRRKTPGRRTPGKTPGRKVTSSSSKKKAMRRLLMDDEKVPRSQPSRETSKRALFLSPEDRKANEEKNLPTTSIPHASKSKRALFGSPVKMAESKSQGGTPSDNFGKRKRDLLDDTLESDYKCKLQKSLSFGGDTIGSSQSSQTLFSRRATEVFMNRSSLELNELHKKKLLWAVSEALRAHGWRMGAPGFREKASALAQLTRRLLALPPHAARLAAPRASTSDTMLSLARQYVFSIIQGRPIEECYREEQIKLANEANRKITGYVSASAYQQLKAKQTQSVAGSSGTSVMSSKIKENTWDSVVPKSEPRASVKNVLQDKLTNVDSNSNSNSSFGSSLLDNTALFKSNSMPSFKDAAKVRARRQISFDNLDLPKR